MRKHLAKRVVAAALTVGLGVALTACSSGGGGTTASVSGGAYKGPKVTVTFWNGWTGGAAPVLVPKLVSQFNASHKNIQVKDVPMQWGDISSKLPLAVKAGKGPDVAVGHGDDIATYAAQGLLLKSDKIVKSLGYTASDFPKGLFAGNQYKGDQYGIPWSVTPLGLYVNKDVTTKAGITDPTTTDGAKYIANLDALKAKGVQGEWVDGYVFTGTFEFESLLYQYGGDLFNGDVSKATFDSPAGVKALTYMTDAIKKGYSPKNVAQDGNINALVKGDTAYNWNGVWQTTNDALSKTNWEATEVPQIGTQKGVWASSTDWEFLANKGQDTNKTAAAAVFVKWMNDHSSGWAATGELPANNKVRNDPSLVAKYPHLKPFLAELPYAHYETVAPGITNAEAEITTAVNNAVLGKMTPKQALDASAAQATKLLAQNKATYGG
ncbi:ABC transporter substrate-binding protein [Curtobacterium sp. ISL-83]|uniref:ABC transporter substrate-binding protein n=1 Tax=Curtobacterium sp. ISL-83 TaxID=2819145 RepID=UPI001BE66D01|nr:ABC transporter substrate-binding protein [Curtobacterium sp. ISL-83]MBT2503542.1 ABC transporter substrate-binding protein [Curtobacterium sp. ISL-83]